VKELLADRSLTLSKVAGLSGFSNDIVLNRVFKKYNGVTPGRYREEIQNDRDI
jgi:two-component system, response regulator YesN